MHKYILTWLTVSIFMGCGVAGSVDARCVPFCKLQENFYTTETLGPRCTQRSVDECLRACDAHIAGLTTLCQSCLLEKPDANGLLPSDYSAELECQLFGDQCTVSGPGGNCTYVAASNTEKQACLENAFPKKEVACQTRFRSTQECANQCAN